MSCQQDFLPVAPGCAERGEKGKRGRYAKITRELDNREAHNDSVGLGFLEDWGAKDKLTSHGRQVAGHSCQR